MGRPRKQRETSVEVFEGWDGKWHGFLTVGTKDNGKPDRRHREGKTEEDVIRKIRELEDELAAKGRVARPGGVPTLEQWLTTWLDEIASDLRYATKQRSYGWAVNKHLVPGLGAHRLDKLEARHIEKFYKAIARDPDKKPDDEANKGKVGPASVHAVHRTLRAALNESVKRGVIVSSPMAAVRPPRVDEEEVTPLFVDEVRKILAVCTTRRNGTRWTVAMPLGLRQGEALGLPWMRPSTSTRDKPIGLDLGGWLVVRRKAERRNWEHGCKDPVACARPRCRTTPCPPRWQHGCDMDPAECTKQRVDRCPQRRPRPGCAVHRDPDTCTKVCKPGCTSHASRCPQRTGGGIVFTDTKSDAGRRRIALAPQMLALLAAHKRDQDREREAAGEAWEDHGLVWCQPNGRPVDPRVDWEDWKALLREAGVRDARVHDGRHTAATMLLLEGIDEQTVMAVMGWSDRRMLRRYQHVIDELREEASKRVGALLWGAPAEPPPDKPKKVKKTKVKKAKKAKKATEVSASSATDLATGEGLAEVIPIRRSA